MSSSEATTAPAGPNAQAEMDLGPLAWVLEELRKSLDAAVKATRRFVREADEVRDSDLAALDSSPLRTAKQQLHQSSGALDMVGMPQAALLLRAMENAVQHYIQKPSDCTDAVVQTLEKSSFALLEYLETVLAGKAISAVALFPQYRDVQALYGNEGKVHPADLWPVERRMREPALVREVAALSYSADVRKVLDASVLQIVKGNDLPAASTRMRKICLGFAQAQTDTSLRIFWKVSAGFFDALAHGLLKADVYTKRVASRVLMLCASIAKGEPVAPERLLQDMLFFCAQASVGADSGSTPVLQAVVQAFGLQRHTAVNYEQARFGRFDPALLAQARKRIAAATEIWSALAGGDKNKIKPAVDQFTLVCDSLVKLHPASQRLAKVLMQVMHSVAQKAEPPNPEVAMEVATSVLYLQAAFASLDMADEAMVEHAETLAQRLERVQAGNEPQPLELWMEQLYRQVSDQQTMGSVVGELRGTLAETEKLLDQYFRNAADTSMLSAVASHLSQMRGVLSVLGLDQASQAMVRMRQNVERFQTEQLPEAEQKQLFEKMGSSLGALGFLIDMLSYQRNMARKLYEFDEEAGELKLLMGRTRARSTEAQGRVSEENLQARTQQVPAAQATVAAVPVEVAPPELVEPELPRTAAPAAELAPVVAEPAAPVQSVPAEPLLPELLPEALLLAEPMAPAEVVPPGVPAAAPMAVEGEDTDDELLQIFLEEAREVVGNGRASLQALSTDPADLSEQTTLRRAFHTLKGSSRMVGLDEFGQAGWAMEQMLNAWLAEQKAMPEPMRQLSLQAMDGFEQWAAAIESGQAEHWQSAPFRASADAMRLDNRFIALDIAAARGEGASDVAAPIASVVPTQLAAADALSLDIGTEPELARAPQSLDALPNVAMKAVADFAQELPLTEPELLAPADEAALDMLAPMTEPVNEQVQDAFDISFDFDSLAAPPSAGEPAPDGALPVVELAPGTEAVTAAQEVQDVSLDEFEALLQAAGDGISAPILPAAVQPQELPAVPEPWTASEDVAQLLAQPLESIEEPVELTAPALEPEDVAFEAQAVQALDVAESLESSAAHTALDAAAQDALPVPSLAAVEEPAFKQVGDLNIALPLFNVYLSEAEGWSYRLLDALTAWQENIQEPQPESVFAWAHSLAGTSATVGFHALSQLCRKLEHALLHVEPQDQGVPQQVDVFVQAAQEIRAVLHQFAAGFLKEPSADLQVQLQSILDSEVHSFAPSQSAESEVEDEVDAAIDMAAAAERPVAEAAKPAPLLLDDAIAKAMALDESEDDDIDVFDVIDPDLFPIFEEEAVELLPTLGAAMREWAAHPTRLEARGILLRALHTLKGSSRLAGALRLGEMAHRLESSLEELDIDTVTTEDIEPLFARLDAIEAGFNVLRAMGEQVDAELLQATPDMVPAAAVQPQAEPVAQPSVAARVPVEMQAQAVVAPVARVMPKPAALRSAVQQTVRVRSQLLDRLINEAGEVMIARSRLDVRVGSIKNSLLDLTNNLERLRHQLRDIEVQAESQMQSRMQLSKEAGADFDPLEFDRFTRVQELTRMMAESVNDVATVQRNLQRDVAGAEDDLIAQGRQARDLQRDLLRTRMVEFDSISERLYAVVRQTSKETGKQVKLDLSGGTIEMDRGVLERMVPAFEHLLRNCVDHGIEKPEERTAAGKVATGTITIHVQQEGNDVAVSFNDDGAGLNVARIRDKALAQGLITADEVVDAARAAQLVFMPGFTTAQQVTGVSGRGIGMDVVRSEVQALGGRIETSSTEGQGSNFRLVLPLTTAVTQVVMLRAGDFSVGVPANLVEVVRRISVTDLEAAYRSGELDDGIEHIPFFWAGAVWSQSPRSVEPGIGKTRPVVIFRSASQRIALHVDEVLGHQEVVVKNLGTQMSRLPGLTGMSVLASGAVVLIYNPVALTAVYGDKIKQLGQGLPGLLDAQSAQHMQRALAPEAPVAGMVANSQIPLVMVVDDSITVRRVSQRLLQREGYRVVTAADGLQALEKLQDEVPCVVLSDIEMPRMDGFDLLRNIRAQDQFQQLPIIMITSRIAQKHRDHAMELGANHYLGKPYSDDELMGLVHHYAVGKPLPEAKAPTFTET